MVRLAPGVPTVGLEGPSDTSLGTLGAFTVPTRSTQVPLPIVLQGHLTKVSLSYGERGAGLAATQPQSQRPWAPGLPPASPASHPQWSEATQHHSWAPRPVKVILKPLAGTLFPWHLLPSLSQARRRWPRTLRTHLGLVTGLSNRHGVPRTWP